MLSLTRPRVASLLCASRPVLRTLATPLSTLSLPSRRYATALRAAPTSSAAPAAAAAAAPPPPPPLPVEQRPLSQTDANLQDFLDITPRLDAEEAARRLGAFLGRSLEPTATVALPARDIGRVLEALQAGDKELEAALFSHADAVTTRTFGPEVYLRGIVEFSNVCANDCAYCGIRKHAPPESLKRYTMPVSEVVEMARWAFEHGIRTLMLQGGELRTPMRLAYLEQCIRQVRAETVAMDLAKRGMDPARPPQDEEQLGLCVALSVGELSPEQYKRLYDTGARRYLLRIETTNPSLYEQLHPDGRGLAQREQCVRELKKIGFQVGTGVMVGLPGQSLFDLAADIEWFRHIGANMVGMGPYIVAKGTPAAERWQQECPEGQSSEARLKQNFELTTRCYALVRTTLEGVHITATTALQAIEPHGRELALRRGCNILMPILTPTKYRENYQLYQGKPFITDTAEQSLSRLNNCVDMAAQKIMPGVWANAPNFRSPQSEVLPSLASPFTPPPSLPLGRNMHHDFFTRGTLEQAKHPGTGQRPGEVLRGSDVLRTNIGFFGRMNAGKSTLMNLLTQQETSIVSPIPGTTTDIKAAVMELHSVGPLKLFDTAGLDEGSELGGKKRRKSLTALKECDVALLVIDLPAVSTAQADNFRWEEEVLDTAARFGVRPVLIFNSKDLPLDRATAEAERAWKSLDPEGALSWHVLAPLQPGSFAKLIGLIEAEVQQARPNLYVPALPAQVLSPEAIVFLNIPMDLETPSLRLLRPQALVQEECLRHFATTLAHRMDLKKARSSDFATRQGEKARFIKALKPLLTEGGPRLLVTDSQSIDVVHEWTLDDHGKPLLPITTFSIAMAQRQSAQQLGLFVEGLRELDKLKKDDKVLISEACTHNRIPDSCQDITTVQIPNLLEAKCGKGLRVEHSFGKDFPDITQNKDIRIAIHCGGCMIDRQKMKARLLDLHEGGVPVTNFGLFFAYMHSPDAMRRCLEPWGFQWHKTQHASCST
eukprot:g3523.t1